MKMRVWPWRVGNVASIVAMLFLMNRHEWIGAIICWGLGTAWMACVPVESRP
jgi:uncharacterized membrane protein YwaF